MRRITILMLLFISLAKLHAQNKGPKEAEISSELNKIVQDPSFGNRFALLEENYDKAAQKKDSSAMASIQQKMDREVQEQNTRYANFIKAHPSSPSAVTAMKWMLYNGNAQTIDSLSQLIFTSTDTKSPELSDLIKEVDRLKKLTVGNTAPNFTQTDISGKPVSLSSLKGKYVLLDFWASWCAPCRKESPNLVSAYETYHDKGFEILSVSVDDNKKAWIKAIRKDDLQWTHVSDLKGWSNEVARLYAVEGIPTNYLINPEGVIIGKNLRRNELTAKLSSLLR